MGKTSIQGTGERFRKIADELFDGNKSELARSLDMKPSSFAKYTDGSRRPGSGVLERLSRLGVNINWFLSGRGSMLADELTGEDVGEDTAFVVERDAFEHGGATTSTTPSGERFVRIPVVCVGANDAGGPGLVDRKGVVFLSETFIDERYGVQPDRLREFRVSGDAMAATIVPGDRLILDVGGCESVIDGEICLVASSAGVLIRRIRMTGNGVTLVADNEQVDDQDLSLERWEETYRPLARVLEIDRSA